MSRRKKKPRPRLKPTPRRPPPRAQTVSGRWVVAAVLGLMALVGIGLAWQIWRVTHRPSRSSTSAPTGQATNLPNRTPSAQTITAASTNLPPLTITNPALAAQVYCQRCHLFPEPSLLDKATWLHGALPQMEFRLGVRPFDYSRRSDGALLREAKVFPEQPILPEEHWHLIQQYYSTEAPEHPAPQPPHPDMVMRLPHFNVRRVQLSASTPRVTLVHADETARRFYVADERTRFCWALDVKGRILAQTRLPDVPVRLRAGSQGFLATMIGRVLPSDELAGSVGWLSLNKPMQYTPVLEKLRRPSDAVSVDLNRDGREDLVVCQFGNYLGRLSWFEQQADGSYTEHLLLDGPGATQVFVRDVNDDQWPDLYVLVGQAVEGVYLFINQRNGQFHMQRLIARPPVWGYSHLELVDFDGDGLEDLLTCNGDNGDYFSKPKPYHGIRLHRNQGQNHFQETWFYPLYGAYKAVARDFDGDGDYDIAAIAFFPDYEAAPEAGFVYLENHGADGFQPFSFSRSVAGRWLTMDAGDLDGDGDADIVLGSFLPGPETIPIPKAVRERWQKEPVMLRVLQNTTRP